MGKGKRVMGKGERVRGKFASVPLYPLPFSPVASTVTPYPFPHRPQGDLPICSRRFDGRVDHFTPEMADCDVSFLYARRPIRGDDEGEVTMRAQWLAGTAG